MLQRKSMHQIYNAKGKTCFLGKNQLSLEEDS